MVLEVILFLRFKNLIVKIEIHFKINEVDFSKKTENLVSLILKSLLQLNCFREKNIVF